MDKIATLVLQNTPFFVSGDCYGCEKGALAILNQGEILKGALGDFDSVSCAEKERIQSSALQFQAYSSHKDVSDSELSIDYLLNKGYTRINVFGALGNRADHQLVNLRLCYQHPEVHLIAENQKVNSYAVGHYLIKKEDFDVFSLFSFNEAQLSISGCEYPLDHKVIYPDTTLTLSNAWLKDEAILDVHEGRLICIRAYNS